VFDIRAMLGSHLSELQEQRERLKQAVVGKANAAFTLDCLRALSEARNRVPSLHFILTWALIVDGFELWTSSQFLDFVLVNGREIAVVASEALK